MSSYDKKAQRRWRKKNPDKVREQKRRWRSRHPETIRAWNDGNRISLMIYAARRRARASGVRFTITKDDVFMPRVCPVFGTKFVSKTPTAATLDRMDPARGYVPGNVNIISKRANRLKSNATPDEIRKLAAWVRRTA